MSELDYRLGDWIVRPRRNCIERGDEITHIKPKTMAVLNRLAQAGGQVVTRDEIFEAVWPGAVVSDATLTQCVSELRSAFGDSAQRHEYIETIPKVGFRLIPEVKRPDSDETAEAGGQPPRTRTGRSSSTERKFRLMAIGITTVVIALVIAWYQVTSSQTVSLAVLPFVDVSEDHDQGSFVDGLTEEMIGRLSQLEGLNVASRTESFHFRERSGDLSEIAQELGVDYILDGSVRRNVDQLRITAQLVQPRKESLLWSEQFDRPREDIFEVQEEIAESVQIALSIKLDVGEYAGDPLFTSSVEAFEEAGKSQQAHAEFTGDSLLRAIHHAKRAVELDPEFGYAWYGLASLYREAGTFKRVIPKEEWVPLALEALDHAIALDPDPTGGWTQKLALLELDHRWLEAQEMLGPITGREMVEDDQRNFHYAYVLYQVGHVGKAAELMEHWRRLHPDGQGTHGGLATMYAAQERYDEAFASVEQAYEATGYSEFSALAGVVTALSANDRIQLSRWMKLVLEHTEGEGPEFWQTMNETVDDPLAALAYLRSLDSDALAYAASYWAAWHGDVELALRAMRRSDSAYPFWQPIMKDVRRHPGFKELARDMNLVDYWREYGWADFCRPAGEDDFECE